MKISINKKWLEIDPKDLAGLRRIMAEYGRGQPVFPAVSEDAEKMLVSVSTDRIVAKTHRQNGWGRVNIFWCNGLQEEMFDGRWRPAAE